MKTKKREPMKGREKVVDFKKRAKEVARYSVFVVR